MAIVQNTAGQTLSTTIHGDNSRFTEGKIVFDATAITATAYTYINLGFKPRSLTLTNITDGVQVTWQASLAANQWIMTSALGARTLDTTASLLIIDDRGVWVLQNATVGLIKASKTLTFEARG
jgi:hypothetical protein